MTKDNPNVRELALYVLTEVTDRGEYSNHVLKNVLEKYQYMEKRDRAFLSRLCEGTLEQLIRIDDVLNRFSKVPVKKMKPVIRGILRLGVYQLLFMDSVPDAAVCNESVKLATRKGFYNLKGFVNGVLRSIAREKDKALQVTGTGADYLSVRYSMPLWIVKKWLAVYPEETVERLLAAFLEPASTYIRCNSSRISPEALLTRLQAEGAQAEQAGFVPDALRLTRFDYLEALPSFGEGLFQVQDASSMLPAYVAAPKAGDRCLDICAAPGGKSLQLADLLSSTGSVEARDLTEYKLELLEDNIARSGFSNITARQWDATTPDPSMKGQADVVLADLPCSGLGVLGRKKDIRYRVQEEDLHALAALQRQILTCAADYVKPGGTLVYSTCTINKEENEENLCWFTAHFPFEPVSLDDRLPEALKSETTKDGYLQLLPGTHPCDGFFLAKLRRGV